MSALVEVEHLIKRFRLPGGAVVHAVDDVSFSIERGETLGLVGESGSGKSTLARLVMRLLDPAGGSIRFDGVDITTASRRRLRPLRDRFQMVFQDPYASLDPKMTVSEIVAEPLAGSRRATAGRVVELFEMVGLRRGLRGAYANELSGGQRQRVAIARAILKDAPLLLLDEATSSLDAESETLVQKALARLMQERTTLVIAHRLATVLSCDRILVMDQGHIVEEGTHDSLVAKGGLYARLARLQFQNV